MLRQFASGPQPVLSGLPANYLPARRLLTGCLLLAGCLMAGCADSKSATAGSAKILLAVGKAQEAIDQIGTDDTAEAHYLKSIALNRLNLAEAADAEMVKAVKADPKNPKYRAMQASAKFQKGDASVGDELLKLYADNPSSGVVALSVMPVLARKPDVPAATNAFRTSVAMSDETPELFPELLTVALAAQMGPEAQALMEKMERISPDDTVLIHQRVAVLLLINRVDDAIQLARTFYRDSKQTETSAILYARALSSAAASPDRDKELQDVVKHFPRNLSILHLYSNYLAKSGRLAEALDHLNKAVSSVPPDAKDMLMHLAIDLPIEFHDPDLGEAELKRFRASITNPTYIIYYEGRLRHLRKDYPAATAAFNRVIDAAKEDAPGARVFAQEAMLWLRQIKYDQEKAAEMQRTQDDLESDVRPAKAAKTAPPSSKTAVPEKTSAADKKKD